MFVKITHYNSESLKICFLNEQDFFSFRIFLDDRQFEVTSKMRKLMSIDHDKLSIALSNDIFARAAFLSLFRKWMLQSKPCKISAYKPVYTIFEDSNYIDIINSLHEFLNDSSILYFYSDGCYQICSFDEKTETILNLFLGGNKNLLKIYEQVGPGYPEHVI